MKAHNPVREKAYQFAIRIVSVSKLAQEKTGEYDLTRQLLRAGTSIGANIEEASAAQSKRDFTEKMCIASKEARET